MQKYLFMAHPKKRVRISKRMLDIKNNLYYYLFLIRTTKNEELGKFEDYTKALPEVIFSPEKVYRL